MSSGELSRQTTPPSSQEFPPLDQTSSTQAPLEGKSTKKERRNPSITPRKFNRFFTPRSLRSSNTTTSSQNALNEIDSRVYNRGAPQSSPIRTPRPELSQANTATTFTRDLKRRKLYHIPELSPNYPQIESKEQETRLSVRHDMDFSEKHENIPSSPCERVQRDLHDIQEEATQEPLEHIVEAESRGLGVQLLQQRINTVSTSRRRYLSYPMNGLLLYSFVLDPD
jgi:hypothetical protein